MVGWIYGQRVRVTFSDGEQQEGTLARPDPDRVGYWVVIRDRQDREYEECFSQDQIQAL